MFTLIEGRNGELISGGLADALVSLSLIPPWRELLPKACRRLEHHPRLQEWAWLNTARATCEHFLRRYRSVPPLMSRSIGGGDSEY